VRVFVDAGLPDFLPVARGNPCRVVIADTEPQTTPLPSDVTQCNTWLAGDGVPHVRCWTPGGEPISLCGHGLLSCGTSWTKRGQAASQMVMNQNHVKFELDGDISWVGFDAVTCESAPVPHWVVGEFGSQPASAAVAGGDAGYLILRWPDNADLRELPVPGSALAAHTSRAVIATCADTLTPELDIRQRYFAPQHGIAEDIATGSAMRVLAHFWQTQSGVGELRAWQCSPEGGHLFSRVEAGITWVGGRVEWSDENGGR